jgi:hypothetical protein
MSPEQRAKLHAIPFPTQPASSNWRPWHDLEGATERLAAWLADEDPMGKPEHERARAAIIRLEPWRFNVEWDLMTFQALSVLRPPSFEARQAVDLHRAVVFAHARAS